MGSTGEGLSFASDGAKLFQLPPSRCMVSGYQLSFLSFTKLSPIHQSPRDPALLAQCQTDVDPVPVPVPALRTVTVNIGAINVRVAVRIPLDVGPGIHVPQGDPTIAIRNVVVHPAIAVRHVEM
jgi:hypothetical protein